MSGQALGQPFKILAVCTMNICRSPAMEQQLRSQVGTWEALGSGPISVSSAGTHARAGAPNCELTLAHMGVTDWSSTADAVTAGLLSEVDVVLTAASDHVADIIALNPSARARVFTLRQAARSAQWITQGPALATAVAKASGAAITPSYDDPHTLTEALPLAGTERLRWLVSELDAVRGTIPVDPADSGDDADYGPNDIADPHVLGFELHELAASHIQDSVAALSSSIQAVLAATVDTVGSHD